MSTPDPPSPPVTPPSPPGGGTGEPPSPPPSGDGGGSDLGIEPKLAGLLCYAPCCIGLVVSVVAAIVEKRNRFVRFHAFQSLLVHAVLVVLSLGLYALTFAVAAVLGPLAALVGMLNLAVGLAALVLMVVLMVKAYAGEELELPVLGRTARQWV